MQRCRGGALWQAQSNQRCSHPRGMSAAISPRHPRLLWAGGALGPTRERAAMQPCRVEHWDAGALGRWGTAEALQENSTGGPTLHRVVALLHAAHIPLRDDIEGVACGAMRYAVRTARPRLHAFGALKCMGLSLIHI